MTEEEFVKRWLSRLAGMALCGLVSEVRQSVLERAGRALDIPGEAERMLRAMFRDATSVKTITNGKVIK